MIVKTLKGSFYEPQRSYVISSENYVGEEEMISPSQRRTLTNLIYEKIGEKEERERWLNQLEDMTRVDAEDAIFDFLSAKWR
jgi:hypothetical protein